MKLVNRLTGKNAGAADPEKPTAAQRVADKALKAKKGSSAIGKASTIKIEPVPEEKDDRYLPVMAPSPTGSPSKVVIKTEKLEVTLEEDGTISIKNSPEKARKRPAAAEKRGGARARTPVKARTSLSKAMAKAGKGVVITSHTPTKGSRKSLRERRHQSGFYSEENQRALKWCKGKGTTKSPYVIE